MNYKNVNELIELSKEIHGNKYDYSLLIPKSKSKSKIICPDHGIFEQEIYMHIKRKQGCPKCLGRNLTQSDFIKECKKVHGDKYLYNNTIYKSKSDNIIITCKIRILNILNKESR